VVAADGVVWVVGVEVSGVTATGAESVTPFTEIDPLVTLM